MKAIKATAIVLASLIGLIALAFVILRVVYPGILRAKHKISAPGIDAMEIAEIGGIQQAMYFRGKDIDNPVILVLHGGPGLPMNMLLHAYQYDWETDFTVVNWDQRLAGRTLLLNSLEIVETMSMECMLADAREVTQYIKQKLNKDKIIVMGFSWGAVLGTTLVQTYPEDYSAYIGVGQIVEGKEGERARYEKALEQARAAGNRGDIAALEAFAPFALPEDYDESIDMLMGVGPYLSKYLPSGVSIPRLMAGVVSTTPYYKLSELLRFLSDDVFNQYPIPISRYIYETYDARSLGAEYEMPVYYIMGVNDWQTPYPVAKAFFAEISAPDKSFFSIPGAGHWAMLDNKAEFSRVLLEEIRPRIDSHG